MTDQYRISTERPSIQRAETPGKGLRAGLWLTLLLSGTANATTSALGVSPLLSIACGLVAVGSIVALVIHHQRHRRG